MGSRIPRGRKRELDALARDILECIVQKDRAGYTRLAEFVDIVVQEAFSSRIGAADLRGLARFSRIEIPSASASLRAVPADPLGWLYRQLTQVFRDQSQWMAEDRDRAADLQQRILPAATFRCKGMEVSFSLRPYSVLSGDFFDLSLTQRDAIVTMGDASGKGVAAALWAAYVLGELRASAKRLRAPGRLAGELNKLLHRTPGRGSEYATLIIARWQPGLGVLTICNGGNPPPHWIRGNRVLPLEATGRPVGLFSRTRFNTLAIKPMPGDVIAMMSDGLSEPLATQGSCSLVDSLLRMDDIQGCEGATLMKRCWQLIEDHLGESTPADDQTLTLIRFL